MKKLVSIVTPVYNEEDALAYYFERMNGVLGGLSDKYDFEFIITDNHSTDKTFPLLMSYSQKDPRIKAFRFSKNFGYQKSILTGFRLCTGDVAIEFDVDLQDPPELLPQFLEEWEKGYAIVYGVRKNRKEGRLLTFFRRLFYRLINKISPDELPVDAGDFLMIDRQVNQILKQMNDQNPYLRGFIFSMGFEQKAIEYNREERKVGTSKFPFFKLLSLAIDGIVSQSVVPLRLATYLGLLMSLTTIGAIVFYIALKLFGSTKLPAGFTTLTILTLLSMGLNGIFLGIIGEYLARIYAQVRWRPLILIESSTEKSAAPLITERVNLLQGK